MRPILLLPSTIIVSGFQFEHLVEECKKHSFPVLSYNLIPSSCETVVKCIFGWSLQTLICTNFLPLNIHKTRASEGWNSTGLWNIPGSTFPQLPSAQSRSIFTVGKNALTIHIVKYVHFTGVIAKMTHGTLNMKIKSTISYLNYIRENCH
jgi:hypothetical protein